MKASAEKPQVVFKHSTRCSISAMAKSRLERQQEQRNVAADFHLINVVKDKPISSAAAEKFAVHHESPQLIVLKNGEVVLDQSHYDIQLEEVTEVL